MRQPVMATDGGGQLTDPVVGRDRPRIAIVTRGTRYRASGFLPHAIGPVHALFAYTPNGGHLPFTRDSDEHRSYGNCAAFGGQPTKFRTIQACARELPPGRW